jgi:hypothetical protein
MQLMGTGVECVWCEGERAAMKPSKDEQIATLTRDLAAAREELAAANATVEKCKAAGFIDEQGNVRKVLGNRWHCSYCDTVYAEYCNGCPRCHLGEAGTSTSLRIVRLVSTTENEPTAAEAAREGKGNT